MKLTGSQYERVTNALIDAFPSQARLEQLLRFRLERNLHAIAMGDNLKEIVFKLVGTAESEGWIDQLICAARLSNPGNPTLFAIAQDLKLAMLTPPVGVLEKVIKATNSFLDINQWREHLGQIEGKVCRIKISSSQSLEFGTGFLIAPNVVMTNYHVVENAILNRAKYTDIVLQFDYKKTANTSIPDDSIEYRLAEDWLIDKSPYVRGNRLPNTDELDYAILRIDGVPGEEAIGKNSEPNSTKRGWIELPTEPYQFFPNTPLLIVQHPKANPLKLAFDTEAIIGVNENGTTVTYRTNTEAGSSGSPCFDINWNLVALHHSGDPDRANPKWNAGTPLSAICNLLKKRNLLAKILSGQPI